jgi:hypothetical protein
MPYEAEYTDTFAGEANYCWVRRERFDVPAGASEALIVRRAKAALGLTGVRCNKTSYGDMIDLRPRGSCTVVFISWAEDDTQ